MTRTDCVTPDELKAFCLGKLSPAMQERVARHLEACADCDKLAEQLEEETDPVLAALRQHPPSSITPLPSRSSASWRLAFDSPTLVVTDPSTGDAPPAPARWIGDYEVLEELGRGGMGIVYRAHQRRLNRIVALKMVLAGAHASPNELTRFFMEAEMVARLTHPSIVQIHEVGEHQGMPFLALEYVSGGTLADQIRGVAWPVRRSAELVAQLVRAVHHAHQRGVVHRDLKPANILMRDEGRETRSKVSDGTPLFPKITDFGLAREIQGPTGLTRTGTLLGTPAYMAPEQANGSSIVGPTTDIYALGIILYELLTGRPPFVADNPVDLLRQVESQEVQSPSRVRPGLPRDLSTICLHCLEKEPQRRYSSAEALAEDLDRFLEGSPIKARLVGRLERSWKWARRRPAIAALLLAIAMILPAATGISSYFALEEQSRARDAEGARDEARRAHEHALAEKRQSDLAAADLTLHAALVDAEAGLVDRAMNRLLDALRLAPNDAPAFRRVLRINLAMLAERLPVLQKAWPNCPRGWFVGPEGATLVTASAENVLEQWETASGTRLTPAGQPGTALHAGALKLSPDGRFIWSREMPNSRFHLRDAATAQTIGAPMESGRAGFTSDGQVFFLTRQIDRFNALLRETDFVRTKTGLSSGPTIHDDFRLLNASNGRTVLMTFPDRRRKPADTTTPARFRDLESGQALDRLDVAPDGGDPTITFDRRLLVTLDVDDGTVRWWDPASGLSPRGPWRPARLRGGYTPFSALAADARTMVALGSDDRLRWYRPATGQNYAFSLPLTTGCAGDSAISPDGSAVLAGLDGGGLGLWRMPPPPPLPAPMAGEPPDVVFRQAAYSPDRRTVFVGSTVEVRPIAHLLQTATGQPIGPSYGEADSQPAFSADGQRLVTWRRPLRVERDGSWCARWPRGSWSAAAFPRHSFKVWLWMRMASTWRAAISAAPAWST